MNRKSIYWIGLGSGLIIGAMLVQLLSLGAEEPAMDLPAIEEAAARHGYRLVRDDESAWIVEEKIVHSISLRACPMRPLPIGWQLRGSSTVGKISWLNLP